MLIEILKPAVLVPWLLGMVFGVFVGATPGLTATMAVALIVPISFYLEPNAGLALIIGVSFTAIFAGDIPATYLRIPGTPASAAATLDGNELAKRGQGSLALVIDLICSCLGGMIGVGVLMLIARPLARFALHFSDFEYFWLGILGLSLSALVSRGSTLLGLIAAALGILISTVGMDVVSGVPRYSFGNVELLEGLNFIPVMIGLFGFAEVLRNVTAAQQMAAPTIRAQETGTAKASIQEVWNHKWLVLRSALLGTGIGALPGAGADIAAWGAYGLAKVTSRESEQFGTGAVEGVIAPTSANNAAVAGAWIPALVFGIPGDAVTAIVLGAMMMYNITPGPQLFESGTQVQAIFLIALVTQLLLLPAGLLGIKAFDWILRLPRRLVLTAVMVFSVVGSFAIRNSLFDVYVMFAFGLIGFFLEAKKVPLAPVILGLILGDLIEKKLRAGLISSSGDVTPMFTRP
ncbi:MAG: tripartite tricarboxylate transporter permease, partial [Pirellulaceae bacterium]|nr:tripartite tricarboxylate transporter permease [Pirellulaceae bacterium]